ILGDVSTGLIDVDLDCPEAIELASAILPATKAVFGRSSKPDSHRLYRASGKFATTKFIDPVSNKMLLEIRGDGGSQTVFPGSLHPSGEAIEWTDDGEPTVIDVRGLTRDCARLAAFILGKRYCGRVLDGDEESLREALDDVSDPRVIERVIF